MHGVHSRLGSVVVTVALLILAGLVAVMVCGCGGGDSPATTSTAATSPAGSGGSSAAGGEGVVLAKQILATFDEVVAKEAELAKDKPAPAELATRLQQLKDSSMPVMTELNGKYLALRDANMPEFGNCNSYLGENRGKHVTDKDNTLTEALRYYNLELGDQNAVQLLSQTPVDLLEVAVKQN